MRLLHGFEAPDAYRRGFVAIGNFDGVHRGHQSMIERLVEHAHRVGGPAVVLTFDPHPIRLLRPEHTPPSLSALPRKAELLGQFGVETVIAYPTDSELLTLSPEEFFTTIVQQQLHARGLVEGPNFYFGHRRAGNVDTLATLCHEAGIELDVVPPVRFDGELVSSSRIRELISLGEIRHATRMLGHRYQLRGHVGSGARRGRTLGTPTANLTDVDTLRPAPGVYAGIALVGDSRFPAAIHLGPNPTFADADSKIEAHLLDFHGDLYGSELRLEFIERVRGIQQFANVAAFQTQLQHDLQHIREACREVL